MVQKEFNFLTVVFEMPILGILLLSIYFVESRVIDYVSTLYGTGNLGVSKGNDPAGVQVPFGMVRLSPDTEGVFPYSGHSHIGGFDAYDPYIRIFSHLHMAGAGVPDYGIIGVMPFRLKNGKKLDFEEHIRDYGFKSGYELKSDVPGYFKVHLNKNHIFEASNIDVELTSTKYVGVHRYSYFEKDSQSFVLFDVSHTICVDACKGAYVEVDPDNQFVQGWMISKGDFMKGFPQGLKVYFHAKTNVKWSGYGTWSDDNVRYDSKNATGRKLGAFLTGFSSETVEVYIGLSFVSMDMAKKNLESDMAGLGFDGVMKKTQEEWEDQLSRIKITETSENKDQLRTFYSGLYRTLAVPTLFSESEGDYIGFDNKVHKLEDPANQRYFSDLSIWDVFRSQFPLLVLLRPDIMQDVIHSLLLMKEQGGALPRWPLANWYTCCMIGNHANIAIVDAYLKGVQTGYNVTEAYDSMRQKAMEQTSHCSRQIKDWVTYGYIPDDDKTVTRSVCMTLAYAYDDGVLARMAKALGKEEDHQILTNRSKNYANVFDPETKFFCPKSTKGKFDCDSEFMRTEFTDKYTEGDAWHWRFYAPHDVPGMIQLFGGNEAFVEQLDHFVDRNFEFAHLTKFGFRNPYFWVGNEHNLASPWLFNFAGRGDLTQKYIPRVIKDYFSWKPEGCPGNDDYGETSSWMVFGSLGFFPIAGSTEYSISSPIFEDFSISYKLMNEKGVSKDCQMNIKLENFGDQNIYIQKLTVNGKDHDILFFDHIKDFGECNLDIVFTMGKDVPQK